MKVSDYIVSYLADKKIDTVFGYIGGMITHLVDSLSKNPEIRFVQTYHEQTAAIAAEGYAKESGNFGVAIATSGPGATNMITGIADAYFDSIPVLYITGQVNTYEYKQDKPIRQQGFQETDVVSMVKPITKYARMVTRPEEIRYELEKALFIALSGRKGPVLLDMPMDIQRAEIDPSQLKSFREKEKPEHDLSFNTKEIRGLLESAQRPILLAGGGCNERTSMELLKRFMEKTSIPTLSSLMGKGSIDESSPNYLGMIGSYGNRCANMGIANADLLIALGTRLDTRQTGAKIDSFLTDKKIIHVDIDENELFHHRLTNRISINSTVSEFLAFLLGNDLCYADYTNWNRYLMGLKERYNQQQEVERFVANKAPYLFLEKLDHYLPEGAIVCADIGQNQMWAAQTLRISEHQKFITSGGLAPMGFSLPAAVGCAFADPEKTVISLNGDGGFHMAIQSLMLISQYNLNIKVVVMNNEALGMITQFQHLYFNNNMAATTREGGYVVPDIKALAAAYGLPYYLLDEERLTHEEILVSALKCRNCIIEYRMDGKTTVSPKLEFDKPIDKPTPLLPEDEYTRSMSIN